MIAMDKVHLSDSSIMSKVRIYQLSLLLIVK